MTTLPWYDDDDQPEDICPADFGHHCPYCSPFEPSAEDLADYHQWSDQLDRQPSYLAEQWYKDALMDLAEMEASETLPDYESRRLAFERAYDARQRQDLADSAWLPRWAVDLFGFNLGGL